MNNRLNSVIRNSSLLTRNSLLALTLLAFALRVYRLDYQSYWIDEAWTVYFAHLSPAELWHLLQTTEIMPPLYHPSTILYIKLFGDSEFALRFYSLIFGVLTVPFTYRLGRDLGGVRLGLIAALLIAVAPFQIWHSQEARMYSLLTAASVMSMWGFVNLWRRGGWRWWLVYMVGTLWAISVHYHGAVLIGVQGLFLLLTWQRHWRGYLKWAASLGVIALLYAPWLIFGSNLLQSYRNWIDQPSLGQAFLRSVIAYSLNELVPREQAIWLILPFVALYLLGLFHATRRNWGPWRGRELLAMLVAYTVAPVIAAWLYGLLRTPVFLERYMILVQVGYLLTVTVGVLAITELRFTVNRHLPYILAGLVLALLIGINGWVLVHYYTDPTYARPDWRGVAQTIANFEQPGDAILLTGDGGENAFDFYYHGPTPVYANFNLLPPTHPDYKKGHPGPAQVPQIMSNLATQNRRLWFTPYGVEVDSYIESWLAENGYPAWHSWIGRKRLALYGLQADDSRTEPLNAAFDPAGGGPTLLAATLPAGPTAAGDVLPLTLTWQTNSPLATDVQLSLRLVNPQGDVFAQSDWPPLPPASAWPPGQPLTDRRALWLRVDVPPGDYLLQLVLYRPDSGQPLGQPVTLPNFTVAAAQITPPPAALAIPNFATPALPANESVGQSPVAIQLVGHALPEEIQPGQELWLWLYWLANAPLPSDATLRLTLSSGDETLTTNQPLAESVGPLAGWQPGQVRRAVYHLPTSPRFAGNSLDVRVSAAGQPDISVGQVRLQTRPHLFEPPASANPLNVAFGDPPLITLLGFDASATRNAQYQLTLYWQANSEIDTNYTVFVQLLNPAGQVVAQQDSQPLGGAAPTTTWLPGEILTDPYTLNLPPGLPPDDYRLITGLYNPVTGRRLLTASGADFVELPPVTVR